MRSRNAVIVFAFIPVILAVTWFLFLRSSVPDISAEQAAELGAVADTWYATRNGQSIPEGEWPPSVKRLRPESVRVDGVGVYVVKGRRFVEEWGVFIVPTSTGFQPTHGGDPSYRLLNDCVYWYEIKG